MKKRILWISLTAIVIVAGLILIYVFNKPRNDVADLPTDYTIEAARLVEEFSTDDEKAHNKYLDKVVQVSGVIAEINISNNNTGSNCILRLTNEISGVICEFEPGNEEALKNYQIGDNITIKGKYSGFLMDVVLNTSKIVK